MFLNTKIRKIWAYTLFQTLPKKRNFASPEASMEYHSRLLMSDRYKQCWKYSSTDFHNWLVSIKSAGYATARDYVQKCERIIMKHKLYLYDVAAERL